MYNFKLRTAVVLIIFKRPDTTEKVFEAIRQAKPPKLLVIAVIKKLLAISFRENFLLSRKYQMVK